MMITRDEAIDLLQDLSELEDFLNEDIINKLTDIKDCIVQERTGLHIWGIDEDDYLYLVSAHIDNDSKESKAWFKKAAEVAKIHTFGPAPCEEKEIEENLKDLE